jgi:hypothetical protein
MPKPKPHSWQSIVFLLLTALLIFDVDWASFFNDLVPRELLKSVYDALTAGALLGAGIWLWRRPHAAGRRVWLFVFAATGLGYLQQMWLLRWYGYNDLTYIHFQGWLVKASVLLAIVPVLAASQKAHTLQRFTTALVVSLALAHLVGSLLIRLSLLEPSSLQRWKLVIDASGAYLEKRAISWQRVCYVGALMTLAWPLALFRRPAYFEKHRPALWFAWVCAVMFIACAFLTYARATILGLCLQMLTVTGIAKWGRRGEKRIARLALLAGLLGAALAFLVSPTLLRRVSSVAAGVDGSVLNRINYFQFALQMITQRPLSGWGTCMFYPLGYAFALVPNVTDILPDVHSSIFQWLVSQGVAGVALVAIALFAPTPRAALALMPRAYLVAGAALIPELLADNLTTRLLTFSTILTLMAATVVARNWAHGRLLEKRPSRAFSVLPPALFALYVVGVLMPPPSLAKWFERVLYRAAQRATDHICFELRIEGSDFTIAYDPHRPHASYLASLGLLASALRDSSDKRIPIRDFRLCDTDPTTVSLELPATMLVSAAAMRPNSLPTLWLEQNANPQLLRTQCQRWLGHDSFGQAEPPMRSETYLPCQLGVQLRTELHPTTATTHQLAMMWDDLFFSVDPVAKAVRRGMEQNIDDVGFLRHLRRNNVESQWYHCAFYTGPSREEVLYCYQAHRASWRLAALYTLKSQLYAPLSPDSAANRQFAELAFRVWSFFDVFDISALPERQYRPLPLLWIIDLYKATPEAH